MDSVAHVSQWVCNQVDTTALACCRHMPRPWGGLIGGQTSQLCLELVGDINKTLRTGAPGRVTTGVAGVGSTSDQVTASATGS